MVSVVMLPADEGGTAAEGFAVSPPPPPQLTIKSTSDNPTVLRVIATIRWIPAFSDNRDIAFSLQLYCVFEFIDLCGYPF